MPFLKPQKIIDAQTEIAMQMNQMGMELNDLRREGQEFMYINPVTGEQEQTIQIVKVNGVWVDIEDVLDAERKDHVFKDFTEEED